MSRYVLVKDLTQQVAHSIYYSLFVYDSVITPTMRIDS